MAAKNRMRMTGLSGAMLAACALTQLACSSSGSPMGNDIPPASGESGGSGGNAPAPTAGSGGMDTSMGGMPATGGMPAGGGGASGGSAPSSMMTAPAGKIPNLEMTADHIDLPREEWQKGLISPTFGEGTHWNQPIVYNGYLQLSGNCHFGLYDLEDPTVPKEVSRFDSPDCIEGKEAESHQVSIARYGDKLYEVTTGGTGVDIWDITEPAAVKHLGLVELEGINYGDNTNAVWGMYWQGDTIYIGGTNHGLFVLDATDPTNVKGIKGGAKEPATLDTAQLGTVSAGPLYALGNLLVVTTPKEYGGIATLDISDPHNPILLDSIKPSKSYIGAMYGKHVYLQSPLRAWDVVSDPFNIGEPSAPLGTLSTASSEYMSFSDGYMFLGHLRPNAGASKIDVTNVAAMDLKRRVWGRLEFTNGDDQFTLALGNLLVMTDDEKPYRGAVIGVHDTVPDKIPPKVEAVWPKDASTASVKSRIGLSFTDNIEIATVHPDSFIVRPMGGAPIKGKWGLYMGVLNFDPDEELQPATTYEVVLPAGGVKDLVGNGLATEFRSTFTTN